MDDAEVWLLLLLLAAVGYGATRFNPAVFYCRKTLTRLATVAIVGCGVLLALGFLAAPQLPPVLASKAIGG